MFTGGVVSVRNRGVGGRVLAYAMVAMLLPAGIVAVGTPEAGAGTQGTVAGKVVWNDANLAAKSVWAASADGQVAGTGEGTGVRPIQMLNAAGNKNLGISNLAVSAEQKHSGIYFTRDLSLADSVKASPAAKERYGVENTRSVFWAARNSTDVVEVEIPITGDFDGVTCGMEVNPISFELVIQNACSANVNTKFMIFSPGADGDPTTIADNSFRTIKGSGPGFSGLIVSDMTLDAQGNIYVVNIGNKGNIYRFDGRSGVARNVGYFTPQGTDTVSWAEGLLGFLDGKIVKITGNDTGDSMGVNPLTLKSTLMPGTNFAGKGLVGTRYDGAGTEGAVELHGTVKNVDTDAGVGGQNIAIYRSNGNGTATLVTNRLTADDGFYSVLLDSSSTDFYARVVEPKIITSGQTKNGEVISIEAFFPVGADSTASNISAVGGNSAKNLSLGTVGTTMIDVNQTDDLVTFEVRDARMVGEADFGIKFAGSTADLANNSLLNAVANTGFGPQHINIGDQLRLGETSGSFLMGSRTNDHASDDGVTAVIGGIETALNGQVFVAGGTYLLKATSQGSLASQAKVRAWVTTPSSTAAVGGWTAVVPPMSADGALAELEYKVPDKMGMSTLRVDSSLVGMTIPINTNGGYAATSATGTTMPWTTIGEVEDYSVRSANAIVRLKAVGSNAPSSYKLTGASANPGTNSLPTDGLSPTIHTSLGGNMTVVAATIPAGQQLIAVNLIDAFTGVSKPATDFVTGGKQVVVPASIGTDTIVEFHYSSMPDAAKSTYAVSQNPEIAANGVDAQTITVTLLDKNGKTVSGRATELTATASSLGTGNVGAFTETESGSGVYMAEVTSTIAGSIPIAVSIGANPSVSLSSDGNIDALFVSGEVDQSKSGFTVSTGKRAANGTATHLVTVTLLDAVGNKVLGQASKLQGVATGLGSGKVSEFVETAGGYAASVSSTVAGSKTVSVLYNGSASVAVKTNAIAEFVAGEVSNATSTYVVSENSAEANGTDTAELTVILKDAFGNLVKGAKSGLSASSSVSLGAGQISEFTEGESNLSATIAATIPGDKSIAVRYQGQPISSGGQNMVAHFVSTIPDLSNALTSFEVTTSATSIIADGIGTHRVDVGLADSKGNPVTLSGPQLAKLVVAVPNLGIGQVSGFTAEADKPGFYEATITSTSPGEKTATVRFDGATVQTKPEGTDKATFVAGGVDIEHSDTRYFVSSGPKKITETHLLTVTLADQGGSPLTGQAGSLFGSATGNALVEEFTESATPGTYTAAIRSNTPGEKLVDVKYGSGINAKSILARDVAKMSAGFIAGDPAFGSGLSVYTVSSGSRVAEGIASHEIMVTLLDAKMNPLSGLQDGLFADVRLGSLGTGGITGFTETAEGSGVYRANVTSTVSGTYGFAVRYGSSMSLDVGGNSFARFVSGDPELGDATLSNYAVTSGAVSVVDGLHKITVILKDKFGNSVELDALGLRKLSVNATPASGVTISPLTEEGSSGVYSANVNSTRAGNKGIEVSFDIDGSGPADPVAIALVAGGNHFATFAAGGPDLNSADSWFTVSKPDGSIGTVKVGVDQKITVKLVDSNGNPVSGLVGLTASALPKTGPTVGATFIEVGATGVYEGTVTSSIPGEKIISVALGASSVNMRTVASALGIGNSKAKFEAGEISAEKSSFTVSSGAVSVDDYHTVTVDLQDKFGNQLPYKQGVLAVSTSPAEAIPGWFTATTAGTYTAQIRSTEAKIYQVGVFVVDDPHAFSLASASNQTAQFIGSGPSATRSSFTVSTGSKTVGESHTVTVSLRDANGNPTALPENWVLSAPVDKSLGFGQIGAFQSTTTLGEYTAQITSTVSDTFAINASLGGSSIGANGNRNAIFVAGPVASGVSKFTVSNFPNMVVGSGNFQTVDVYLTDSYGNAVEDGVAFPAQLRGSSSDSLGDGRISVFTKTPEKGLYQATVWSSVSGGKHIAIKYSGASLKESGNITAWFKAGVADLDAQKTNFTVSPGKRLIGVPHDVTVVLGDQYGNPVSGMSSQLQMAADGPLGTGQIGAFAENKETEPGTYRATVGSSVIGMKTITVKSGSQSVLVKPSAANDTASFMTAGVAIDNVNTRYSVSTGNKNVTETHTVTVTLVDQGGNPVAGQAGSLVGGAVNGATVDAFAETENVGTYTAAVRSASSGNQEIAVSYVSSPLVVRDSENSIAAFVAGQVDPSSPKTVFSVGNGERVANGAAFHEITVTLSDAKGNPITGAADKLGATSTVPDALGGGVVGSFQETGAKGTYVSKVSSTKSGDITFQVKWVDGGVSQKINETANANWIAIFVAGEVDFAADNSNFAVSSGAVTVGVGEHKITARLSDGFGNPILLTNALVQKLVGSADPSAGVTVYGFSATEIPGVYQAQVRAQNVGTKNVVVKFDSNILEAVGNNQASWVADAVDPNAYETWFDVTDGEQTVATGAHTVTVKLADRRDNPVSGQAASLSGVAIPSNGVTFVSFTEVDEGVYQAQVRSDVAGTNRIKIFQGGSQIYVRSNMAEAGIGFDKARFSAGAMDSTKSSFTVSDGEVSVEGGKHQVRVTLRDSLGNPISGVDDRLYAVVPGSEVIIENFVEIGPGYYTAGVSSELAANFAVYATAYGSIPLSVAENGNRQAAFKNGGASLEDSSFTVTTGEKVIGIGRHTVSVTLEDLYGNAVVDGIESLSARVPASLPLGAGKIGEFSQVIGADGRPTGVYTAAITSTKAGDRPVTAMVGGSEVTLEIGGNQVARHIAGVMSDEHSYYSVSSGRRVANGIDAHTVTTILQDRFFNRIEGMAAFLDSTTSPDDTLSGSVFVESASEKGQYSATIRSKVSGDKAVSATVDGRTLSALGNNQTARFTADGVDLSTSDFQVSGGSVIANGLAFQTVTVTLRDSNLNPVVIPLNEVPLILVKVKNGSSLGSGKISALVSQGDGRYTATVTSTIAKDIPLWVTMYAEEIGHVGSGSASFFANPWATDADGTHFEVGAKKATADGIATVAVTVRLVDMYGNAASLVGDQVATIVASTTGQLGSGKVSGFTPVAGQKGTYGATVTSTVVGVKPLTVSIGNTELSANLLNTKASFVYGAADFNALGTGFAVSAGTRPILTGVHTISVLTVDKHGNSADVADVGKLVAVTADDIGTGKISVFTRTELGTYTATLKSNRIGQKKITVSYDGKGLPARGNKVADFDGTEIPLPAGLVKIVGTATVGSSLMADAVASTWPAGTACAYQWKSAGTNIPDATMPTYVAQGKYVKSIITVSATCSNPNYTDSAVVESAQFGPVMPNATRIGGTDRYQTSALVNNRFGQDREILFIATGQVYADALSAGSAAARNNGSLMLTNGDSLTKEVQASIAAMHPSQIYIMGQENSVSLTVENQLSSYAQVSRIGGKDRYETSYLIYKEFFDSTDTAYLATGAGFADALVASAAAGYLEAPVILVNGKNAGVIDVKVRELMEKRGVETIHIAGGPNTVNLSIESDVKKYFEVSREYGADRYETAIAINQVFAASYFEHVWVATGKNFPDALSGAVPAATLGEPIYLSKPDCLSRTALAELDRIKFGELIVLGGTSTLSNSVLQTVRTCS